MTAFHAARIFDGIRWHDDSCLLVEEGLVQGIVRDTQDAQPLDGWIVPGLVDLQVNGGGGTLFNDDPTPEGIARIAAAHARLGTTSIMVTLITDTAQVTARAIGAAAATDVMGLHLEGPHLAPARKGAHDAALIRPMEAEDVEMLVGAAGRMRLICTFAPEVVGADDIGRLVAAGVIVSLGHSDATACQAHAAADAGATMVTHLFNAMSQLGHRAPGLVGAALSDGRLSAGLIADGFHVDPVTMGIALRAKAGPGRIFLVSDAMSPLGTDLSGFMLNGRQIHRHEGRLTLADGTLAGADISLLDGVRHVVTLGVPPEDALRMASIWPAQAVGDPSRGGLMPGQRADFLTLGADLELHGVWIGGRRI